MFDGVGWAAGEIVAFMLIATLIGLAIGWIFGRWLQRGTIAEGYEAELSAQRELAQKAESRLSESNKKLDKVHLDLKGEQARISELTSEVDLARTAAGDLEAKLGDAAEQDAEIERLATELAGKGDLESKLTAAGDLDAEVSRLKMELSACGADRDGLTVRVAELEGDLAVTERKHGSLNDRIAELEDGLASREQEISRLESELDAVPEPQLEPTARVPAPKAPASTAEPVATEPTKEQGLAKIAEIAARTSGGGPAVDDDLKKVHGIGPKLEQTLKGLGITSFRQVANFQADDIVFVTAALDAFKGRIERDDWMASAAELHMKKYNEPA